MGQDFLDIQHFISNNCTVAPLEADPGGVIFTSGSDLQDIWILLLRASEITANLYCNCVYLYWGGCVI